MSKSESSGFILIKTYRVLRNAVPRSRRIKAFVTLLTVFFNSITDLLGLASLIPLFMVIIDREKIQNSDFLHGLYTSLKFSNTDQFVVFLCIVVVLFILLKNLISIFFVSVQSRFSYSLYRYFSQQLYSHYYRKGLEFIKVNNSNHLVNNISNISLYFVQHVVLSFFGIINELIVVTLVILGMFFYNPQAILILLITILPIVFLFSKIVRNKIYFYGVGINKASVEISKNLFESFHGYIDIEIRNRSGWLFSRHRSLLSGISKLQNNKFLLQQIPLKVIEIAVILSLVMLILVAVYSGENLVDLSMLLGVFGIAAYRILPSINRILLYLMTIRSNQHTFEIIEQIPGELHGKPSTPQIYSRLPFQRRILIENLSFSFDGEEDVLKDVSFTINKGERVGIVGRSGSGKTTLLNILLGFLFHKTGKIKIDDADLTSENVYEWRNIIGYVPQEVFILDASLAENIALGQDMDKIDLQKVREVIKLARLDELVETLQDGLTTNIGEHGSKLSVGQKQRIGIARALYNDAEILFFDEATSSLDNETEEEINDSIKFLFEGNQNLTIVMIAHRITSLKHCTKILELKKGRISKQLTYSDLLEKNK